MEDKKILVFYVGVGELSDSGVADYMKQVSKRFFNQELIARLNAEVILLPTRSVNSSIECINPTYITDKELIIKHEELMKDYLASLNKFIKDQKSDD